MDAVQRQRQIAMNYGYLRTNGYYRVVGGPYIQIVPLDPAFIVVPAYNPAVVFFAPRPGFAIGAAISFSARASPSARSFPSAGVARCWTGGRMPSSSTAIPSDACGPTAPNTSTPTPPPFAVLTARAAKPTSVGGNADSGSNRRR